MRGIVPSTAKAILPAEREIAYVSGFATVGGVFAFIAWAAADFMFPDQDFDAAEWILYGVGLTGAAGLAMVASNALY